MASIAPTSLRIALPGFVPCTLNRRDSMHWSARKKLIPQARSIILQRLGRPASALPGPLRLLQLRAYAHGVPDLPDNLGAAFKPWGDALEEIGWLRNDADIEFAFTRRVRVDRDPLQGYMIDIAPWMQSEGLADAPEHYLSMLWTDAVAAELAARPHQEHFEPKARPSKSKKLPKAKRPPTSGVKRYKGAVLPSRVADAAERHAKWLKSQDMGKS